MEMALNLLLAGIVIVFFVLILLIIIIKIYGAIIQAVQNKLSAEKAAETPEITEITEITESEESGEEIYDDGTVPGEIIAVIAAAVDAMYEQKPVKIKSVKRGRSDSSSASAWRNAALLESTKPF